jgi:ABC-2 type transport system permease protein
MEKGCEMIFWVALRKELLEQWRSYRLLIVAVVLLLFGLTSPLLAKYTPEFVKLLPNGDEIAKLVPTPTSAEAVEQYVKNISQFGILLALLMTMGAVAQEKDKGTAALMMVKPMPRGVFLTAKFVALGVTFTLSILIAGAACYYYTLLLFEALDISVWLALNGLMLLFVLVYVALTLFCSTLSKSQVVGGGLAFGLLIVLSAAGALPKVGEYLPGQLITWAGGLMNGGGGPSWPALWASVGLILTALIGAWAIFERQEL